MTSTWVSWITTICLYSMQLILSNSSILSHLNKLYNGKNKTLTLKRKYTRNWRITSLKWFTSSCMTSFTTALFLIAFARCANLSVLKVSLLQLQYGIKLNHTVKDQRDEITCSLCAYLWAGEIAQTMANLAFPPRDSCNKNVNLESL